jgi:hypothetical protein
MSLKFKRNLPTVMLLISIIATLIIFMGEQQVTSYSINTETLYKVFQFNISEETLTTSSVASIYQLDSE